MTKHLLDVSPPLDIVAQGDRATRQADVKWVLVVDGALGAGLMVNTAVCLGAAIGEAYPDVVGDGGLDADGAFHAGLPWTGCTVLKSTAEGIDRLRTAALATGQVVVADMASVAQTARVYDDYLSTLATTPSRNVTYHGVALLGPRKAINKLVGRLPLLR